jgi:hypothetical protein
MRKDWPKLRKRICRRLGIKTLKYVAIVEWTEKGAPHLHILCQCGYLRQRWLSGVWKHLHGAPIVDIRKVTENDKAAAYLAKYLTKCTLMPKRLRRWSATRGYLPAWQSPAKKPEDPALSWKYDSESLRYTLLQLQERSIPVLAGNPPTWIVLTSLAPP